VLKGKKGGGGGADGVLLDGVDEKKNSKASFSRQSEGRKKGSSVPLLSADRWLGAKGVETSSAQKRGRGRGSSAVANEVPGKRRGAKLVDYLIEKGEEKKRDAIASPLCFKGYRGRKKH